MADAAFADAYADADADPIGRVYRQRGATMAVAHGRAQANGDLSDFF